MIEGGDVRKRQAENNGNFGRELGVESGQTIQPNKRLADILIAFPVANNVFHFFNYTAAVVRSPPKTVLPRYCLAAVPFGSHVHGPCGCLAILLHHLDHRK